MNASQGKWTRQLNSNLDAFEMGIGALKQNNSQRAQMSMPTTARHANHILEVQSRLRKHIAMRQRRVHTTAICLTPPLHTTQLPFKHRIEIIHMFLRPLYACRHHHHREAVLVDERRVLDAGEVDERQLIDELLEIAFEDTLSV
jgi:hypothetical protein